MAQNFDPTGVNNLIGLWDFRSGNEHADTGLDDGVAQDGSSDGRDNSLPASFADDYLIVGAGTNWHPTAFHVDADPNSSADDEQFNLDRGTLETQFIQTAHSGSSVDVILSRGEKHIDKHDEGYFEIRVTHDGQVQAYHNVDCGTVEVLLCTPSGFFHPGDEVNVKYVWDTDTGAQLIVENLTTGETDISQTAKTGLTFDITDNDDEEFTFGARETDDSVFDKEFQGKIDFVALYDERDPNATEGGDGYVEGTAGDDVIDINYSGDPEGDMIDAGDAVLPGEGPDDDIVLAGAGDDDVKAGDGDDDVYGGAGNDLLQGEGGNDRLFGDGEGPVREVFRWDELGNPAGDSQDTGLNNVTFSILDGSASDGVAVNTQLVDGIDTGPDNTPAEDDSSYDSLVTGGNQTAAYQLDFDLPVENVSFRINDVDIDSQVTVTAFVDGLPVEIILDAGSNVTLTDTDGVAGDDTATSNGGNAADTAPEYSVLVTIPGPVDRIVIDHVQDGGGNSGVNITDVYFDTGVEEAVPGGDDTLLGGDGDDLMDGGREADILVGGEGDDTALGGDGDDDIAVGGGDTAEGGSGDDVFTVDDTDTNPDIDVTLDGGSDGTDGNPAGPENGDDGDILDLSDRTQDLVVDFEPNPEDGTVDGLDGDATPDITFSEIETVLTGSGDDVVDGSDATGPIDVDTGAGDDDVTGGDGDDTIVAGDGDDTVDGGAGDDDIDGGDGNDVIAGGEGADNLDAGEGDDDITLGAGDTALGGGGDDEFFADPTLSGTDPITVIGGETGEEDVIDATNNPDGRIGDTLDLRGLGDVTVVYDPTDPTFDVVTGIGESGTATYLNDGGQPVTIAFSEIENVLTDPQPDGVVDGEDFGEVMNVGYDDSNPPTDGGGDLITDGDDVIEGNGGDDTIRAGGGDDAVDGGTGNDIIFGQTGNDTIDGGAGNDEIGGAEGDDELFGGDGDDTITGGSGSDVIDGGADDDLIDAGSGDDVVQGGTGNDTITTGDGNDNVDGGDGDDVIDTSGHAPLPDIGFPGYGAIPSIPADGTIPGTSPFDDRDFVFGGAGNDTITTGDDRDFIDGGDGDDVIDAGIDDDTVFGQAGNDLITAGEGNDTVEGGDGNDTIYGGLGPSVPDALNIEDDGSNASGFGPDPVPNNGRDVLEGGAGDDTIFGEDDDDLLVGGTGNDFLDGGIDDDTLLGEEGNDILRGGQGADLMDGGDDADTFIIDGDGVGDGIGDEVIGGEGGDDFDTLDLTQAGPQKVVFDADLPDAEKVDPTGTPGEAGKVFFYDGNGFNDDNIIGEMTFKEVENILTGVICYTPGTLIATPRGEVPVESLREGQTVITRDNGIQEIRWAGRRELTARELMRTPQLRPILIKRGALGDGLPERDMLVSPQHRMLVSSDRTQLFFDESEVLVAAKHLVNHGGIQWAQCMGASYVHFMFDQHEVVLADGAWSESFQPGDHSLGAMQDGQRAEIFSLFPNLREEGGRESYQAARRALKGHEARLLVD